MCAAERRRRCRVLQNSDNSDALETKFADAPLIHPWNAPKYHASLVRARLYAKRTNQVLLWCVAEDTPLSADHRNLPQEELDEKRREWVMHHDQKTSGIMGLLPLVKNMPLRITETDPSNRATCFKKPKMSSHRRETS